MNLLSTGKGSVALGIVVITIAAVGTAAGVTVTDTSAPEEALVGEEVTAEITLTDLYTSNSTSNSDWTLRGRTELVNVTSWRVTKTRANGSTRTQTFVGQEFELPVSADNNLVSITVTVTGETPSVEAFSYRPAQQFTAVRLTQTVLEVGDQIESVRVHHYTNESREARKAIQDAETIINGTDSDQAESTLRDAIAHYNEGEFDQAISAAQTAEETAGASPGNGTDNPATNESSAASTDDGGGSTLPLVPIGVAALIGVSGLTVWRLRARNSDSQDRKSATHNRREKRSSQSETGLGPEGGRPNRTAAQEPIPRQESQAERDAARAVTDSLNSVSATLDTVADTLEDDPESALERLDNAAATLAETDPLVESYDLSDAAARKADLQDRLDSLREQVVQSTKHRSKVPKNIPTTKRRSLAYDALEKGNPLGSGGNADVYYATTDTDEGVVELALKEPRMSGTLHADTVERMLDEADTWQRLDDHDHIVSVVDYGAEPLPWIAMEYMDAGHLGDRAAEMDLDQALWTAIATTKAVRHAHRRGIAHLDLKPANVLLRTTSGDTWDVPKVADWGLSKHLLEHSKSIEGMSPHYAAPEQFDEEFGPTDDVTDVYQLGAVFYELFTGRPPFEGRPTKVMNAVMHDEPPAPSDVADVPSEMDEILLRALAKEKGERYESVLYLRDDLQEVFDGL